MSWQKSWILIAALALAGAAALGISQEVVRSATGKDEEEVNDAKEADIGCPQQKS